VSPALQKPEGLEPRALASALVALEVKGSILRGRFVADLNDEQWCDRRLLARIHHYTVARLRSEIEPVAPRDFLSV
jgi:ATP-dependent Lhr-like helicase